MIRVIDYFSGKWSRGRKFINRSNGINNKEHHYN
jgi:hypothetical protein